MKRERGIILVARVCVCADVYNLREGCWFAIDRKSSSSRLFFFLGRLEKGNKTRRMQNGHDSKLAPSGDSE